MLTDCLIINCLKFNTYNIERLFYHLNKTSIKNLFFADVNFNNYSKIIQKYKSRYNFNIGEYNPESIGVLCCPANSVPLYNIYDEMLDKFINSDKNVKVYNRKVNAEILMFADDLCTNISPSILNNLQQSDYFSAIISKKRPECETMESNKWIIYE